MSGSLWFYWREYYAINQRTCPDWPRRAAALNALKLALRIRRGQS